MESPAPAPTEYDQTYQTELNTLIGNIVPPATIVLQSPDGTFYKLSVENGGGISGISVEE